MNLTSPESLVIISDVDWKTIFDLSRYSQWYELARIFESQDYRTGSLNELSAYCDDYGDLESILDLQLKFFLLRNSSSQSYPLLALLEK